MSHSSRGPTNSEISRPWSAPIRGHLGQLVLGQQHRAAALGHPVDGDALGRGLLHARPAARPGPPRWGSRSGSRRRPGTGPCCAAARSPSRSRAGPAPRSRSSGQRSPGPGFLTEGFLAAQGHHATSRTAGRGGTSSSSSAGQPGPGGRGPDCVARMCGPTGLRGRRSWPWGPSHRYRGDPFQAGRGHQVGVLGLGPAGQAGVPGHRLAGRDRRGVPARVPLGRARSRTRAARTRSARPGSGRPSRPARLPGVGLVQDGKHVAVAVRRHAGGQRVALDPQHPGPQRGELRRTAAPPRRTGWRRRAARRAGRPRPPSRARAPGRPPPSGAGTAGPGRRRRRSAPARPPRAIPAARPPGPGCRGPAHPAARPSATPASAAAVSAPSSRRSSCSAGDRVSRSSISSSVASTPNAGCPSAASRPRPRRRCPARRGRTRPGRTRARRPDR